MKTWKLDAYHIAGQSRQLLLVIYCWLPPVLASYLHEVLRMYTLSAYEYVLSSPLLPKPNIGN